MDKDRNPVDVLFVNDWLDRDRCDFDNNFKWLLEHRFFQFCYQHSYHCSWGHVCYLLIDGNVHARFCIKVDGPEKVKELQSFSARIIDLTIMDSRIEGNHLMSFQMNENEIDVLNKLMKIGACFDDNPAKCVEKLLLRILDIFPNTMFS